MELLDQETQKERNSSQLSTASLHCASSVFGYSSSVLAPSDSLQGNKKCGVREESHLSVKHLRIVFGNCFAV